MEFRIVFGSFDEKMIYADAPKIPKKDDNIEIDGRSYRVTRRIFSSRKLNKRQFDIFVIVKEV